MKHRCPACGDALTGITLVCSASCFLKLREVTGKDPFTLTPEETKNLWHLSYPTQWDHLLGDGV
jgi:hypothetical protein